MFVYIADCKICFYFNQHCGIAVLQKNIYFKRNIVLFISDFMPSACLFKIKP